MADFSPSLLEQTRHSPSPSPDRFLVPRSTEMAVIQDLPPELLFRVLALAGENNNWRVFGERARLLKTTSLVARDWTAPSQALLRRNLIAYDLGAVVEHVGHMGPGSLEGVQQLTTSDWGIDSPDEVRTLLSSLTSLRSLTIIGRVLDSAVFGPELLRRESHPPV